MTVQLLRFRLSAGLLCGISLLPGAISSTQQEIVQIKQSGAGVQVKKFEKSIDEFQLSVVLPVLYGIKQPEVLINYLQDDHDHKIVNGVWQLNGITPLMLVISCTLNSSIAHKRAFDFYRPIFELLLKHGACVNQETVITVITDGEPENDTGQDMIYNEKMCVTPLSFAMREAFLLLTKTSKIKLETGSELQKNSFEFYVNKAENLIEFLLERKADRNHDLVTHVFDAVQTEQDWNIADRLSDKLLS